MKLSTCTPEKDAYAVSIRTEAVDTTPELHARNLFRTSIAGCPRHRTKSEKSRWNRAELQAPLANVPGVPFYFPQAVTC